MLRFPAKTLRATVVRDWMVRAGVARAVCFTCGNAGWALVQAGVDVLCVGAGCGLVPGRWWTQAQIRAAWPARLDATSGHLPVELLLLLGEAYRAHIGPDLPSLRVPSGSGETVVALALAYPGADLVAVYDDRQPETTYHPEAPLTPLVRRLCAVEGA